jgi:glycosyltransferase involved in cell wall biosynthesis
LNIDVILPTYNRADALRRAIDGFLHISVPGGCRVHLFVIDNNSKDNTKLVVQEFVEKYAGRVSYFFEGRQGKEHALNCGIANSDGEIVAFFDDDEVPAADWLEVVAKAFEDPSVEFIGGPVRPVWSGAPPAWIPPKDWGGVLGIIDNGPTRRRYGTPGFGAMLVGGNTAIRRTTLVKCGEYSDKYTYGEDRYMYEKLIKIGSTGEYIPEMVMHHYIPEKRLTKNYFRHWAYVEGKNEGRKFFEDRGREKVILGVPRWRWWVLAHSLLSAGLGLIKGDRNSPRFAAELEILVFWGFYRTTNLGWIRDKHFDRS